MKVFLENRKNFKKETLGDKKWFIYDYEIIIIISLALFAAILNEIPNWYVTPLKGGVIDPILSYPLRDNIIYTSFSMVIVISIAIFIGIFTETGKFAGKYGSAIFVLVPSFVWLLSDRSDNRIESVLSTSEFLGSLIFYSIVTLSGIFIILYVIKIIMHNVMLADLSRLRMEFFMNLVNRFILVLTNILIVLMLAYTLINYGILSLHLADNTPEMQRDNPNIGTHNLHSEKFTTYIAIVAIFFALLMITIGLTNIFVDKSNNAYGVDEIQDENQIDNLILDDKDVFDDTSENKGVT